MTLRQALGRLADQGLVSRAPGHTVDTVVLAREEGPLPGWVAERLGLPAGARGLRIERLRRLGTTPAIHQTSWIPEELARRMDGADLTVTSLYDALGAGGV